MVAIEVVKEVLVVVEVVAGWKELTQKFASGTQFFKFVTKTLFWLVSIIVLLSKFE